MQQEASTKALIEVNQLSCSLSGKPILKNINLSIQPGEFVGLIGPNGSGKTTLLKCMDHLIPYSGSIRIDGKYIHEIKQLALAKYIAMMHQDITPGFPFPAMDVVLMGRYPYLKRFQPMRDADFAIAEAAMSATDTIQFKDHPITELSGGERQRVLFAKAIAQQTPILLLDEPSASLDMAHEEHLFQFADLFCKNGGTVVAAIHDLRKAAKWCSRLVLLKEGAVYKDGMAEEVLTHKTLSDAFQVNALVYRNPSTAQLDIHLYEKPSSVLLPAWIQPINPTPHVYVIGGGGSADAVLRYFFEKGWQVTLGIVSGGDSDYECARIFDIPTLECNPFMPIPKEMIDRSIQCAQQAELTILCNMPFGLQNLHNLDTAMAANRLVVIEDVPIIQRDYTGGIASERYQLCIQDAQVIPSAHLQILMETN